MASLQPILQGHTVVSPDSLIATVLPKLGSTPDLGRLRLVGKVVKELHDREDEPSLAGFVKKALMGGWVTPAQRELFSYGDDSAALRIVAHDIAWHMGQQVQGSYSEAFPEDTATKVRHAIAPHSIGRADLAPLLKEGLRLGFYAEAELSAQISNDRGAESRLLDFWQTRFLQLVQSASPLAHKHPCKIATDVISARVSQDDPNIAADVVFRWGLAEDMMASVLNLASDESPEGIRLRDLVMLLSAATQAVAIDFLAPYEVPTHGMGFMGEDDLGEVKRLLGDTPPTVNSVHDLVMLEIPMPEGAQPDLGTIMEHTSFESLMMHVDAHLSQEDHGDPVRDWCAGIATVIATEAYMRNPLHDVGGLKDEAGNILPNAVIEHVQSRLDAELPAVRAARPAVADTLATWATWLSEHVAAGGEAAEWEVLDAEDYEDAIPLPSLIQACPGLFVDAELGYGEQIHEHIMNGAGTMAAITLEPDHTRKMKRILSAASCANALAHTLTELAEQMEGDTYTISAQFI